MKKIFLITIFLLIISIQAFAQDEKPDIRAKMEVFKVVVIDTIIEGKNVEKEVFKSAEEAFPGDVVQYELVYWNEGDGAAKDVSILGPVPENTAYIGGTATELENLEIKYSIDKGKTFHFPPIKYKTKEVDENGVEREVEKIATPDMYTHIKWNLKSLFTPEEKVKVTYRVKIL